MKTIAVAAAVIINPSGAIFLAKRAKDAHQGGLWEFPGGKLEAFETSEQALTRELAEELGIRIQNPLPFISLVHSYSDKKVELEVFIVSEYRGKPWGKEGQETQWCAIEGLKKLEFPAANLQILEKILQEYS
jgi:8-oxo-dGTP diphosphatase